MDDFRPGEVLAGKYRVDRVLGRGGMGVVLAATHLHLKEPVAIKLLLPGEVGNEEASARFLREARASAKLKGDHVVRVIDFGMLPSGSPMMVMEYLEGDDLGHIIEKNGPMTPAEALDCVMQACEAIAEAHRVGIVHRDLKPSNLFLSRRPNGTTLLKVLDFGISKVTAADDDTQAVKITNPNSLLGSPQYMSPEQLRNVEVDPRTDVWSLGCILFELLTGRSPFSGNTLPEVCSSILNDPPAVLPVEFAGAANLRRALESALVKDREKRCPDVVSFAALLVDALPTQTMRVALSGIQAVSVPSGTQPFLRLVPDRSSGGEEVLPTASVTARASLAVVLTPAPARRRLFATLLVGGAALGALVLAVLPRAPVAIGDGGNAASNTASRPGDTPPVTSLSAPSPIALAPEGPEPQASASGAPAPRAPPSPVPTGRPRAQPTANPAGVGRGDSAKHPSNFLDERE